MHSFSSTMDTKYSQLLTMSLNRKEKQMNPWWQIYKRLQDEINSHSHSLPCQICYRNTQKILHNICLKRLVFDTHFTVKRCKVSDHMRHVVTRL